MRRLLNRTSVALVAVAAMAVAVACQPHVTNPPGPSPLRYRDAVFSSVTKTSNVVYGSAKDQTGATVSLTLDVYQPTGDTVTKRPAVIWVHGGSFRTGDKSSVEIVEEATTLAKEGYVTFSINYRLSKNGCATGATGECLTAIVDAKHDAQAAVRFLRSKASTYKIDTTRIAIGGTSAGAITALNVGYGSEDVGDSGNPGYPSTVRSAVSLSGASLVTTPNPGEASALLFHGTADPVVPYSWATRTVDAAKTAGLEVELTTFEGAGHVPYGANRSTILTQTSNFLFWELDLTHAAH